MEKLGRMIAAVLISAAIAGCAAWYSGKAAGRTEMQVEAVKNTHGHYRIVDELGHTQFEWGQAVPGTAVLPK